MDYPRTWRHRLLVSRRRRCRTVSAILRLRCLVAYVIRRVYSSLQLLSTAIKSPHSGGERQHPESSDSATSHTFSQLQ